MKNLPLPFLLVSLLAGCSSLKEWSNPIGLLSPYRIDIQQGNLVTQEMLDRLKPGMTPSQVRFVLGTPLVVDPFHKERWDYVYTLRKDGKEVEKRRITVLFADDKLKSVEGDIKPAAGVSPIAPAEVRP